MKAILVLLFAICICASHAISVEDGEDYLTYSIPRDAKRLGPLNTRIPKRKWFNYFLAGAEPSNESLIGRETYDAGQLIERALYKHGVEHGVQIQWHRNGTTKSQSPYKNGVMHGTFRHWSETGELVGQYEIVNGTGIRRIYNSAGRIVCEEALANGQGSGLQMKLVGREAIISLMWENDGRVVGKSFSFYSDGDLRSIDFASNEGLFHGPRVSFSERGDVISKRWFVNNAEVREAVYASAAQNDASLPGYLPDASKYKDYVESEVRALCEKYRNLPPVRIPLTFDQVGNPVPR